MTTATLPHANGHSTGNVVAQYTIPEKILLAAHQLEEAGQSPFSCEALVVAAWQKFPRAFGLKGYSDQYPDANRVISYLCGPRGLPQRGLLAKMGQKLYALTREGRGRVRRLMHDEPTGATKLSRAQEKFLLGLLASNAVEKFQQGLRLELSFADACTFWGITENLRGDALDARMAKLRADLAEVGRVIGTAGADLSNGRNVSPEEVLALHLVDDYLTERFGRHLALLRNRQEGCKNGSA